MEDAVVKTVAPFSTRRAARSYSGGRSPTELSSARVGLPAVQPANGDRVRQLATTTFVKRRSATAVDAKPDADSSPRGSRVCRLDVGRSKRPVPGRREALTSS